jgi:chromosome partitioning protein
MKIITVGNYKGGSGKTTSAVFLVHAFRELGLRPLLVDADPQGSATRWHQQGGLDIPLEAMASRSVGRGLAGMNKKRFDVVVVDTPPVEEEGGIVEAALGSSDLAVLTLAPTVLEFERVRDFRASVLAAGRPQLRVLLNRVVHRASSTSMVRADLEGDGVSVLRAEIPRREAIAWAFGEPVRSLAGYLSAAEELLA